MFYIASINLGFFVDIKPNTNLKLSYDQKIRLIYSLK